MTGFRYPRLQPRLLIFLLVLPIQAHVISISTGTATISGARLEYILRIPAYEVPNPQTLLDHIHFQNAKRIDGECHLDNTIYLCAANYQFPRPIVQLTVDCTFYEVTVPNHIHMLRAELNGKSDQAILDSAFPEATLNFRPPTPLEQALDQSTAGASHVWRNLAQVLLLIALAIASRAWSEFAVLFTAFLAGECAGTMTLLRTAWQPQPRFAEAAAALALAYLALEILAFPKSGGRWLLAILFGAFEGMFFALFISESGYRARWVLTGAALGALSIGAVCALAGVAARRLMVRESAQTFAKKLAGSCLLATGVIGFAIRLRS